MFKKIFLILFLILCFTKDIHANPAVQQYEHKIIMYDVKYYMRIKGNPNDDWDPKLKEVGFPSYVPEDMVYKSIRSMLQEQVPGYFDFFILPEDVVVQNRNRNIFEILLTFIEKLEKRY